MFKLPLRHHSVHCEAVFIPLLANISNLVYQYFVSVRMQTVTRRLSKDACCHNRSGVCFQMKQQSHPCGEVCADIAILDVHFLFTLLGLMSRCS